MENIRALVCKNFNRLLDSSGLKQKFIAEQIKVNPSTLQRWKDGVSYPELPNIEKLADIFGVDPLEFYRTDHASKATVGESENALKDAADILLKLSMLTRRNRDLVLKSIDKALEGQEMAAKKREAN